MKRLGALVGLLVLGGALVLVANDADDYHKWQTEMSKTYTGFVHFTENGRKKAGFVQYDRLVWSCTLRHPGDCIEGTEKTENRRWPLRRTKKR